MNPGVYGSSPWGSFRLRRPIGTFGGRNLLAHYAFRSSYLDVLVT